MEQDSKYPHKVKQKPSLGVVAISFNEERDLPRFIEHLYSWVDEIVIIDDGSSDNTQQIAESWGNKIRFVNSPRAEGEYFSHQRNKGIDQSKSDWLLHMDIDERVPQELANEVLGSIKNRNYDAYRFRRLNYFLHRPMRGGGWQDWNMVHLAKREIFHFDGMYHEECIVDAPADRIGQLNEKMWHLNDDTYMERMSKSNLYCQEQSKVLADTGLKVRWWHLLMSPLLEFGNKYFRKRGYLDGTLGLLFALHSSCAAFRACALLWDDQNRIDRGEIDLSLASKWNDTRLDE